MSLDLQLFPVEHLHMVSTNGKTLTDGFSQTVLNLPGGRKVHAALGDKPQRLPEGHTISGYLGGTIRDGHAEGESYYGVLCEDPYGNLYTWVDAGVLLPILQDIYPTHPTTAYVAALPGTMRIILGWR